MNVHNHGTEDGPGLACKEFRLADGSLKGQCLIEERLSELVQQQGRVKLEMQGVIGQGDKIMLEFRELMKEFRELTLTVLDQLSKD